MRKKLITNINWLFGEKVLKLTSGLFITIWVARYLGPEKMGVLNYALAYTSLFAIFVNLGFEQIVVRELVKQPKLTGFLLGTAFALKLLGTLLAILSIYFSLYFLDLDTTSKTIIFIISAGFIFQSLNVIDFFYQSKILSKFSVIARNIAFVISSSLKIFFILYQYDVVYFAFAGTVDFFLSGLFLLFIYKKNHGALSQWHFSKKIAIRLLKYSWPVAVSSFLISIHMRIDQVMIGNMLDSAQVGLYSVSVVLMDMVVLIPGIIVSSIMPYFIGLRENNNRLYHYRLVQLYFLMFWGGILAGFFAIIFGKEVIVLLYGESYLSAYNALVFNIWAGAFMAQSAAKGIWVIAENKQFHRIIPNIVAAVVNVILNFLLIPLHGISGAAIATLITKFVNNWVTPMFVPAYRNNTIISIKSINPFYLYRMRRA